MARQGRRLPSHPVATLVWRRSIIDGPRGDAGPLPDAQYVFAPGESSTGATKACAEVVATTEGLTARASTSAWALQSRKHTFTIEEPPSEDGVRPPQLPLVVSSPRLLAPRPFPPAR